MNQPELFRRWATGQIQAETVVGSVHAQPHRLFYGPAGSSLALRHNDMVLVSAIHRSRALSGSVISTHRVKLYAACEHAGVEFSHAVRTPVLKRPGYPAALFVARVLIEDLLAGRTPEFFQIHEAFGYALSGDTPDQRVFTRYLFVCRMLGIAPIHDTIEEMAEWHRCVSILSPQ